MSHQLRILALPEDWQDLGRLLALSQSVLFLEEVAEDGLSRAENFYAKERLSTYSKVFLARDNSIGEVITALSGDQRRRIDSLRSPVVEAGLCFFDGALLRAGRLYYETGFYGRDQKWKEKSDSFISWAASVFRVVRRAFPRDPERKSYVGDRARQWMTQTDHRIALF